MEKVKIMIVDDSRVSRFFPKDVLRGLPQKGMRLSVDQVQHCLLKQFSRIFRLVNLSVLP